ncbi:hypothetical protein IWX81_001730 [Salinibacterium sp. CAN_S4]|uniref:integrase core domain-containing protein n=1 Tax=Salinibacterium sp. CAN_S4 TaxID=2787727 RepID=UPI0018EF993F
MVSVQFLFIDHVLSKLPFQVEKVQTDNGSEFGQSFHWHLLDKGINHVYIKPATPRLNGKVERSHRIDSEEFYRLLEGQVIDDVNLFNDKLQGWEDYYNYDRPHGALAGSTPYERLNRKHKTRCHRPTSVAHLRQFVWIPVGPKSSKGASCVPYSAPGEASYKRRPDLPRARRHRSGTFPLSSTRTRGKAASGDARSVTLLETIDLHVVVG